MAHIMLPQLDMQVFDGGRDASFFVARWDQYA
jgi:hypothetical protein